MSSIHTLLLILHIAGGTTGLISGFMNILNKKGSKLHRLWGRIYISGMFTATLSGILLATLGSNYFLFLIGVFSFYLAFSGFRTLKHRAFQNEIRYGKMDKIIAGITAIFGVLMFVAGIFQLSQNVFTGAIILFIFGAISLVFSLGDLLLFIGFRKVKELQHRWFFNHIGRMIGSYISAVTAFLVVNLSNQLPALLIWLGPTLLGSILITGFTSHFKRKFAARNQIV